MVGAAGFEPTTPGPPDRCATGLRYAPPLFAGILSVPRALSLVKRRALPGAGVRPRVLPVAASGLIRTDWLRENGAALLQLGERFFQHAAVAGRERCAGFIALALRGRLALTR